MDRHSLYCVPVPAENNWVIQKISYSPSYIFLPILQFYCPPLTRTYNRSETNTSSEPPSSTSTGLKRRREEGHEVPMNIEEDKENVGIINNANISHQQQTTPASCTNNDFQFAQPAKKTKTGTSCDQSAVNLGRLD